jgi:hypothetical protein
MAYRALVSSGTHTVTAFAACSVNGAASVKYVDLTAIGNLS